VTVAPVGDQVNGFFCCFGCSHRRERDYDYRPGSMAQESDPQVALLQRVKGTATEV
jgi:hypothetical protein